MIRASESVRLGRISVANVTDLRDSVNSARASRPLGNRPIVPVFNSGSVQAMSCARGARARADTTSVLPTKAGIDRLEAYRINRDGDPGQAGDLPQEGAFAPIAFHQMDGETTLETGYGEDETREAGAGTEIQPGPRLRGQVEQLQGIRDVAGPDLGERGRPNEILDPLPPHQLGDEDLQTGECFT